MRKQRFPSNPVTLLFVWSLLIFLAAFFSLVGCSTAPLPRAPLMKQITRYREGHKGLTHNICVKKNWKGDCVLWDLKEYDPNDIVIKKGFIELRFVCRIGGQRYKFDPDAPQFVRYREKKECFLLFCSTELVKENPILFSEVKRLIDSDAYCYSEDAHPDGLSM